MKRLQFGHNEDIDLISGALVFEVEGDRFTDVAVEVVDSFGLGKNVFADAAGAPEFFVVVHLNLRQHG